MAKTPVYGITVPLDASAGMDKLRAICKHFNCSIKKKGGDYYEILTDDPTNFFWLGCNLNHMLNGTQISNLAKFMIPNV